MLRYNSFDNQRNGFCLSLKQEYLLGVTNCFAKFDSSVSMCIYLLERRSSCTFGSIVVSEENRIEGHLPIAVIEDSTVTRLS